MRPMVFCVRNELSGYGSLAATLTTLPEYRSKIAQIMNPNNRQQLIDRLVMLFEDGAPALPLEGDALRQHLDALIGEAEDYSPGTETRRVTILLSDLRGFTAISENFSAPEMVAALNRYYTRMTEIILRYGGSIDKFMGDAIMALFGAPHKLDDAVEAALACAIEMQLAMEEINLENQRHAMTTLHMGIGINSGMVVVGQLGSWRHREYTVIGDEVNLASRIEAHSLRGQILLSESTYEQAKSYIDVGDVNEVFVKGKKGSVRMFELLGMRGRHQLTAPERETRNSPRVEVDLPLVFQTLDGKSVLPEHRDARIINISYGGMSVASTEGMTPFVDIKMALSLTLLGRDLTEIYAKVLRVALTDGEYRFPVEFTAIDPAGQKAIKEFVDGIVELNRH